MLFAAVEACAPASAFIVAAVPPLASAGAMRLPGEQTSPDPCSLAAAAAVTAAAAARAATAAAGLDAVESARKPKLSTCAAAAVASVAGINISAVGSSACEDEARKAAAARKPLPPALDAAALSSRTLDFGAVRGLGKPRRGEELDDGVVEGGGGCPLAERSLRSMWMAGCPRVLDAQAPQPPIMTFQAAANPIIMKANQTSH